MPGTHQATVTAKTGPNVQVTALVIRDVKNIVFDFDAPAVQIQVATGAGDNIKEFDLTGVTTITCTITAGNSAWVIS
jgi:hypothetical protein